jgi:GTP-binding protein EngB required for normal cell division/tetratricopeptide (TPR) repeat protein
MGILDRIAGTLDELTRSEDATLAAEIDRAQALAAGGDAAGAEAALRALTGRAPRAAAPFRALGKLQAQRGALDDAVTALGRAVDLDGGDPATWLALGEALAELGRVEPARDALRRVLTLGLDGVLRGKAYAALGRVHAHAGEWAAAARAQRKALELSGPAEVDRALARDYGRTLAELGDREATEWLTRAARADLPRSAHLFIEAAAATPDDALAERLLREGLAGDDKDRPLRGALATRIAGNGRYDEAVALAEACVAEAPDDGAALRRLREIYVRAGRWSDGLRVAADEARVGQPPPLAARIALALGAGDRATLAALAAETSTAADPDAEARSVLGRFVGDTATDADVLRLGRLAPGTEARRFLARAGAPPAPPAGQLAGLLTWAHDFAASTPALGGLAAAAGHAAEAIDRPLLVAVMGEFNAGKSSFVNALAGEEIAPVGVTPTTATVNVLRYGAAPTARVLGHDGGARELAPHDVTPFLTGLSAEEAREIRQVEIFLPVETLRRVAIVDTPGLNSIRPEHERVAREFLQDADAIVWVFSIGQAAKATEKQALTFARDAGKRVLGVLNKIDRADRAEVEAVVAHVSGTVGELVETIVPLSATRAFAARKTGAPDAGFAAVTAALERQFFAQARALKRATALAALRRFVAAARAAVTAPAATDFTVVRGALAARAARVASALAGERVALRARIDEAYRRAALEVREFIKPRSWLFGEHRATPDDEEFLGELLEDAVTRAAERTRHVLLGALETADARAEADAIAAAVDRFVAYARGVIESGAVPDFFRNQLPRLRLDVGAIRDALARRAPDPEEALFAPLRRALDVVAAHHAAETDAAAVDAETRALVYEEQIGGPLSALAEATAALDGRQP